MRNLSGSSDKSENNSLSLIGLSSARDFKSTSGREVPLLNPLL